MTTQNVSQEVSDAIEALLALDRAAQARIGELRNQNADDEAERLRLQRARDAIARRLEEQRQAVDRGHRLALQGLRDRGEANTTEYQRLERQWLQQRIATLETSLEELRQLDPTDPFIDTMERQLSEAREQLEAPARRPSPAPEPSAPPAPAPAVPVAPAPPVYNPPTQPVPVQTYPADVVVADRPNYFDPREFTGLQLLCAVVGAILGWVVVVFTVHPLFGDIHNDLGRVLLEILWYVFVILFGFFSFGWLGWMLGRSLGHHD